MPSAAVCISCISIHALCEEGDLMVIRVPPRYSDFYPRPLRGGRQTSKNLTAEAYTFLSTPSARRATFNKVHKTNLKYISIHALCEEGDLTRTALLLFLWIFLSTPSARRATLAGRFTSSTVLISIHALCEEGDPRPFRSLPTAANFYPRPLRGGRPAARSWCPPHSYFYPRPLRGGRRCAL